MVLCLYLYFIGLSGEWQYCDIDICKGIKQCKSKNDFACSNGACVSRLVECDGTDDCGDGSDETIPCDGQRTKPPLHQCRITVHGEEYTGSQQYTSAGNRCMHWNSINVISNYSNALTILLQSLDMVHNFCRNPRKL